MGSLDRPKLRPLSARRVEHGGRAFAALEDPLRVFTEPILIPLDGYHQVVRHFDGRTPLPEIRERVFRETGRSIASSELEAIVSRLDRELAIDGPSFHAYREGFRGEPVRPPAFAGRSYPSSERSLRADLDRAFLHAEGAGRPGGAGTEAPAGRRLRGVLSPHIDFQRGGPVYTWAYRELIERSDAEVFVIVGVAHQWCENRFALTRKDFATPLGRARTDRGYVDRVAAVAGERLFEDELAHRVEHSVEFQVVFLQHLLNGRRDFAIVPILVGSFHDLMARGVDPIDDPEVGRFVEALRSAEAACGKRVLYVGGVDFSHVGPEFGDPDPVDAGTLDQVRSFDRSMLERAEACDPSGWFRTAAEVGNRWRVCGLAATYTMLHAIAPSRGRVLKYAQAVDEPRTCCVTFASVAYDEGAGGGPW